MLEQQLQPVEQALRDGYTELARNLLRVLIEDYPEEASVWYWAAQAAVNDNQQKAFLKKAVDLDPLHHQAANALYDLEQGKTLTLPPDPNASVPQQQTTATTSSDPVTADIAQPQVRYAKLWRRSVATLIDMIPTIIVPTLIALGLMAMFMPDAMPDLSQSQDVVLEIRGTAILFGVTIPIQIIYYGLFLTRNHGQTPGKMLMTIRVVKQDGSPITLWDAILRNVIGYEIGIRSAGLSFFWGFFDNNRRTWHDYIVKTIVVDAD